MKKGGILMTLDPENGEVVKMGRLMGTLDDYYVSPVAADGKVYLASMLGKITVFKSGGEWAIISTSDLAEDIFAIADGRMYVRTSKNSYGFAKQ